MVGFNLN